MEFTDVKLREMLIEAEERVPFLESLVKHRDSIAEHANVQLAQAQHELEQMKRLRTLLTRMLDPNDWQQTE